MDIKITEKEFHDFNIMFSTLQKIAYNYQSAEEIRENSQIDYSLDFEDAIEMAYDNIQGDASHAISGVKRLIKK